MSNLNFTICCTVTFFSKKRRTPPNLNNGMYYPHFVIKGTESWYKSYGSKDVIFDKQIWGNMLLVFEIVNYFVLKADTEFFIMEDVNSVRT